jgi:hypothetical protein
LGRGIDIVLNDLQLGLNDVFTGATVNLTKCVLCLVALVAEDEDTG